MNIFKSKLLWFAPIAAILLLVIFSLAFYPAFNPKPKQIPIAVVNNDKGIKVKKESDIKKGLNDNKYYGAAIFNKNFSKNAMSKTQLII